MASRAPSARADAGASSGVGRISQVSTTGKLCERCRKRKVKCDRSRPCMQCISANVECTNTDSMKKRPISRAYATALEDQVSSLEVFIMNLASASHMERDRLLENYQQSSLDHLPALTSGPDPSRRHGPSKGSLLRMNDGVAARFFGETSYYPIVPSVDEALDEDLRPSRQDSSGAAPRLDHATPVVSHSQLTPQSPVCQQALSAFFQHAYYYHMVFYREYFLRDYKAGHGPYYSDLLFYAIVSIGALVCQDKTARDLSDVFYERAGKLLYGGALDSLNITTIQALLLLGQRDVGCGKQSQGWLLTGLAFRMVHEMGLHLDPNHWKTSHDSEVEREVLRRVYWACFIADKQLSLYFGRPPALHPSEADVNDSVRIAYPVDWDSLLDEFIKKDTSRTQYEDGVAFTSCFAQLANLSKIVHRIITEVFEYRKTTPDASILEASTRTVHVALTKWLADLPSKLHWNQWLKSAVPPYILHLHLYYHTVLIVLYRPPRQLMSDRLVAFRQGFDLCEQSLAAILQLLKVYARDYGFDHLPMPFLHTAATAASMVLLKLHVPGLSNDMNATAQQLEQISKVVDSAANIWAAAVPIQDAVNDARQKIAQNLVSQETVSIDWENLMTLDWQPDPRLQPSFPIMNDEQPPTL